VQQLVNEDLSWCPEVKTLPWCRVIGSEQAVEVVWRNRVEVGFPQQIPAQPAMCVFDTALLPRGMGIAEIGFETKCMQTVIPGELSTVVEGKCFSQALWQEAEPILKMLCDEVCGFVFGPVCQENAGRALVEGENVLSVLCKADEIAFPVPWHASAEYNAIAFGYGTRP
jgi:hypothetical protein